MGTRWAGPTCTRAQGWAGMGPDRRHVPTCRPRCSPAGRMGEELGQALEELAGRRSCTPSACRAWGPYRSPDTLHALADHAGGPGVDRRDAGIGTRAAGPSRMGEELAALADHAAGRAWEGPGPVPEELGRRHPARRRRYARACRSRGPRGARAGEGGRGQRPRRNRGRPLEELGRGRSSARGARFAGVTFAEELEAGGHP